MKYLKSLISFLLFIFIISNSAFAFESGFNLQLKSQFGGALTLPEISEESLTYLNSRATAMTGGMSNLLMGIEAEVGYIQI